MGESCWNDWKLVTCRIFRFFKSCKGRFLENSLNILKHKQNLRHFAPIVKNLTWLLKAPKKTRPQPRSRPTGSIQGRWVSMTSSILPHDFPAGKGMKRHEKAALGEKFLWISLGISCASSCNGPVLSPEWRNKRRVLSCNSNNLVDV